MHNERYPGNEGFCRGTCRKGSLVSRIPDLDEFLDDDLDLSKEKVEE